MRFSSLVTMLVLLSGLFSVGQASGQSTQIGNLTDIGTRRFGEDWPVFLGPTGDGKSTETGIIKDWSNDGLRVVWDIPLSESYGTCTVSKGRVFQFDSMSLDGRTNTGILLCLNSKTGKLLWRYTFPYQYRDQYGYNSGPRTSPIVDDNRVFIYGVDGKIVCLDAKSGEQVWFVDANQRFGVVQNFFGVGSNPVVVGDLLVVMVGGSPPGSRRIDQAIGNRSGIVAFNKFSGQVEYKFSDVLAGYASLKNVQYNGRPWCFVFAREGLLAFDPRIGKQDFFFPWRARILESVNASVPVIFQDHVFISETYGPGSVLLKFARKRPTVVWQDQQRSREKSMQTHWNTSIYVDGYLYGSSGRHEYNAELRCINASTGKVRWSEPGLTRSSLMFVDGHFVCLSEDGTLRLIGAKPRQYREVTKTTLRKDGRRLLRPPAWAAPILSHGLLYVRGRDRLVCAELIPPE